MPLDADTKKKNPKEMQKGVSLTGGLIDVFSLRDLLRREQKVGEFEVSLLKNV